MVEVLGLSVPLLLTVAGVALLVAEALVPGAHFVVVGVALLVAGLVGLALGSAASPLVLAAVVLAVGSVALWGYRKFDFYGGKGSGRTQDSSALVGQEGRVVERVTETSGRVRLVDGGFDPDYSARTVDGEIPEGTTVLVTDPGGGSVLTVESLEDIDRDAIDRELARGRESDAGAAEDAPAEDADTAPETAVEREES
jgi:membrane protein implicated in regulation of membrane protease activity